MHSSQSNYLVLIFLLNTFTNNTNEYWSMCVLMMPRNKKGDIKLYRIIKLIGRAVKNKYLDK